MTKEEIKKKIEELSKERNSLPVFDFERARIAERIAGLQLMLTWA